MVVLVVVSVVVVVLVNVVVHLEVALPLMSVLAFAHHSSLPIFVPCCRHLLLRKVRLGSQGHHLMRWQVVEVKV